MKEDKPVFTNLIEHIKDYINTRIDIIQLNSSGKLANILSGLITNLILVFIVLFFILFASICLGIYISQCYNNLLYGFIVVTMLYAGLGLIFIVIKEKYIKRPLVNNFIKQFFKESDDKEQN
ncbi:MAG: hypothetical protein Q8880_07470 [Bacteroidota bacterium]|nr:hypothetical protein [Bacteroidota bacterium]